MKFIRWAFLALSLAMVLVVTLWESEQRVSPGPLHPAHAQKRELDGNDGCVRCHGSGGATVDASACSHCHEGIGKQLQQRRGLHGGLADAQIRDCGRCHREHHGTSINLLDARAFQLAGVERPERYDHRFVPGFPLVGKHAELRCEQCHKQAVAEAPPAGGRFLTLQTTCTACHEDRHKGEFGNDCNKCHGQELSFDRSPGFAHTADFPLTQAHAGKRCSQCHQTAGNRSVAALLQQPLQLRGCADCHDSPHGVVAEGQPRKAIAIANAKDCASCHDNTRFRNHNVTNATHERLGYTIAGVHATLRCEQCHGAHGDKPRWSDKSVQPSQCSACHESPHRQEFVAAVLQQVPATTDCGGCHTEQHRKFAQGIVSVEQHAVSGFPLALPHDRLACDQCHGKSGPTARTYAQRYPGRDAKDCRGCHRDVHAGQFDRNPEYRQCTACHQPLQWAPPRFDLEAHGRCQFPLLGQHQAVACRACHDKVTAEVRAFVGTPMVCGQCHKDPHGGRFDKNGLPQQIDGRAGCARCHDELRFAPVRSTFDHDVWTGFPLLQSHRSVECRKCHGSTPDPGRPALGKALGNHCADCHRDVHQGQFRSGGSIDCQRCHDESKWKDTKFDHQRDSRFKLDATHAAVPCSKCHIAVDSPDGAVTRYRPLGVECKDCHIPGGSKGTRK